jgi:hypothetical protein
MQVIKVNKSFWNYGTRFYNSNFWKGNDGDSHTQLHQFFKFQNYFLQTNSMVTLYDLYGNSLGPSYGNSLNLKSLYDLSGDSSD